MNTPATPQTRSTHPLIYSYLQKYQEDPTSRVFAPLAEAYRKSGLIDEAIEIAEEGLRIHPHFVGGRVALARALFDKKRYADVVEQIKEIVRDVPDNIVAQRLMGESCLMLGRVAEALSAFKMLLYFAPQDDETARIVHELEAQAYQKGTLVLRTDTNKSENSFGAFQEQNSSEALQQDPELKTKLWIQKIERLQLLLLKVERYKVTHPPAASS